MICRCSPPVFIHLGDSKSNGGISNLTVTKTSDHTLVITPNRTGSPPPYPSRGDGGHDTIRGHVHSVRPGSPGDVTVGGAAPVHPSSSGTRSRRGNAAGRPVGCLWLDTREGEREKERGRGRGRGRERERERERGATHMYVYTRPVGGL
jgi:hypothetical protein